jgi:hypothetical protein
MPSDTTYAPHIPDAVRRASQRADELAREAGILNVPPAPEGEETAPQDGEDVTTVVEQPEGRPEGRPGEQFQLPEIEPAPEPAPVQRDMAPADWEQRYNTLQGKYNTEIADLRGQLRATQELIASMQAQPRREEPRREQSVTLPQRDVPPEDIEAYGQDLVHAAQRWAMLAAEPKLSTLEQRLALLEGTTQHQVSLTATQRVEDALDRAMPNWREVNVEPGFIGWLQQVDPFSGQRRKQLIDEAYTGGDAARTIAFFQAYTQEHTTVSQSPGTQPVQTGSPADRLPLADLAVPGRGATAAPPTPGAPQRRIWTGADITTFYRQRQRGNWVGREAEAERIEQDIFAAEREGRIRQ